MRLIKLKPKEEINSPSEFITKLKAGFYKRGWFGKIAFWYFMFCIAYVVVGFIQGLVVRNTPFPGFRSAGAPLTGGWNIGDLSGCFNDVAVLQFDGSTASLVVDGKSVFQLLSNVKQGQGEGFYRLEANMALPGDEIKIPGLGPLIEQGAKVGTYFHIKVEYKDLGKVLNTENLWINGKLVENGSASFAMSLFECGYPDIRVYWDQYVAGRPLWKSATF